MLNLSCRLKIPPEDQLRPLQQLAGQLDVPDVRGVVLGVDIVVLQHAVRIEVVHKPLVLEMLVDVLELGLIEGGRLVLRSGSREFAPLRLIGQSFCIQLGHFQRGEHTSKRTTALGYAR